MEEIIDDKWLVCANEVPEEVRDVMAFNGICKNTVMQLT